MKDTLTTARRCVILRAQPGERAKMEHNMTKPPTAAEVAAKFDEATASLRRRVEAIEYDENVNVLAIEHFEWAEDAMKWCETRRGEKLVEGDTHMGFQLMTKAEWEVMSTSEWPKKWYEVHGFDGENARELEVEDWKDEAFPS